MRDCDIPANIQFLTSEVMAWTESIWIFDLNVTARYWRKMAQRKNLSLFDWCEKYLVYHLGHDFRATWSHHPWHSLLLLQTMTSTGRTGLLDLDSIAGQKLWQSINWHQWLRAIDHLSKHWPNRKDSQKLRSQKRQMYQLVAGKLDLQTPAALKQADRSAIQRRFGDFLAEIWQWTFSPNQAARPFPWTSWHPPSPPTVGRNLDYPMNSWAVVEPLLGEDLAKIYQRNHRDIHLVTEMTWQLTLQDMTTHELKLGFRNPYDFCADAPHHKTAVLQAEYAFAEMMAELSKLNQDSDLPLETPVIAWQLELSSQISRPKLINSLFPDQEQIEEDQILALENKLPVNLNRYQLQTDFSIVDSYQHLHPTKTSWPIKLWQVAAHNRPLFIHQTPRQWLVAPRFAAFLERVSLKWWQQEGHSQGQIVTVDYYIAKDENSDWYWMFKTPDNLWFEHGLFD